MSRWCSVEHLPLATAGFQGAVSQGTWQPVEAGKGKAGILKKEPALPTAWLQPGEIHFGLPTIARVT